ncbi:MAG: hypothetical protein NTW95_08935 [Candidatus Aminicenantes bacterium]|nr:hypothetical protein [Candidatus Aminicenantes bacterium]
MKRTILPILVAALAAAIFSFTACKQAETVASKVLVVLSEGVTGVPEQGTYNLVSGDTMQYSFSLKPGYSTLTVLWNGNAVAASGTLTLGPGEHTLQAYADDNIQRGLTVTVGEGVSGMPAVGTFNYGQGATVSYSYAVAEGYFNLTVLLDGTVVDSSGTITMDDDHTLDVTATAGKKLRDTWVLAEVYDDGSSFTVNATFSGNYASGTVSDSQGGSGTFTFIGSTVAFNLVFPNVTYEYSGTFTDDNTMGGTCKRYQTADKVFSGNWVAKRKSSLTVTSLHSAAKANWRRPSAS